MDKIIVKVKDLYEQVKLMSDDGMDFVELSLLEADSLPDGDEIPASIYLSAWSKKDPYAEIVYDGVDAVEDSE